LSFNLLSTFFMKVLKNIFKFYVVLGKFVKDLFIIVLRETNAIKLINQSIIIFLITFCVIFEQAANLVKINCKRVSGARI
jgi:hypothetical protein